MRRTQGAVAAVGFAAVLGLAASVEPVLRWGEGVGDSRAVKDARRATAYIVRPDRGPRFALHGDERELRIVSHLLIDGSEPYDQHRRHDYGIEMVVSDETGQPVFEATLHTGTLQSKAGFDGRRWLHERAFTLEGQTQLADDRVLTFSLPDELPPSATLELRLRGEEGTRAAVRVYRAAPRSAVETYIRSGGLSTPQGRELLDGVTFRSWQALTEQQRDTQARRRYVRMSAIGRPGLDHETLRIYTTDFRLRSTAQEQAAPVDVAAGKSVAYTLWGPGVYELSLDEACHEPGAFIEAETTDAWGITRVRALDPCDGAPSTIFEVPGEAQTLVLRNLARESDLAVGATLVRVQDDDAPPAVLQPDLRRSSVYLLRPDLPPTVFDLVGGETDDVGARVVRVDVRQVVDNPPDVPLPEVRFAFLDAQGQELQGSSWSPSAPLPAADLESLEIGEPPARIATTDAASVRVIAPPEATRLVLSSSHAVVARASVWLSSEGRGVRPASPYGDVMRFASTWQRAPLATRDWYPIRSPRHEQLIEAGAVATVLGHTRLRSLLEPAPRPLPALPPRAVHPRRSRSLPTMEIVSPEDGSRGLTYTQLPLARTLLLDAPDRRPLRITFVASNLSSVGQEVTVNIGGESFTRRVWSSRGSWSFPDARDRSLRVRVSTDARGLTLIANRATRNLAGHPLWRPRTLHRLAGRGLRVPLYKRSADATALNVVLYGCGGRVPTQVSVTLDDGEPNRIEGAVFETISEARRRIAVSEVGSPTRLLFLTGGQRQCRIVGRFAVPLGGDIAPGRHVVHLEPQGGGELWARFFQYGGREVDSPVLQWIERNDDAGGPF